MCKATVQVGPRKGEACTFPAGENGYCDRHQRNYKYDKAIEEGKHMCRFFFRGCDAEITQEEYAKGTTSCVECRAKLQKKQHACEHEGCTFKVKEAGFCKKHERDKYKKEEKEKGIRYCDIARGCFKVCEEGKATCADCLEKLRQADNNRYATRKQRTEVLQNVIVSDSSVCVNCGKDFETFKTRYNKPSKNCKNCAQTQKNQDAKRVDRVRNYKKEHALNLEQYYKIYITKASVRELGIFQLDFETFSKLVKGPCYYCGYLNPDEINGIDRVNNDKGYIQENCVGCCATCNKMKSFYHPSFFIQKCKLICKDMILDKEFLNRWEIYWSRTINRKYTAYKKVAELRNLLFNLTETQYYNLTLSPCYLCNFQYSKGIGLDRVDNSHREYSIHTVKPCCGTCNIMKSEQELEAFLNKCKQISDKWPTTEQFNFIPIPKNPLKEYREKGRASETKDRKNWKAPGLYYALLSNTVDDFQERFNDVLKTDELLNLTESIRRMEKEDAIAQLQTFIRNLKKRKQRLCSKAPVPPSPIPTQPLVAIPTRYMG